MIGVAEFPAKFAAVDARVIGDDADRWFEYKCPCLGVRVGPGRLGWTA